MVKVTENKNFGYYKSSCFVQNDNTKWLCATPTIRIYSSILSCNIIDNTIHVLSDHEFDSSLIISAVNRVIPEVPAVPATDTEEEIPLVPEVPGDIISIELNDTNSDKYTVEDNLLKTIDISLFGDFNFDKVHLIFTGNVPMMSIMYPEDDSTEMGSTIDTPEDTTDLTTFPLYLNDENFTDHFKKNGIEPIQEGEITDGLMDTTGIDFLMSDHNDEIICEYRDFSTSIILGQKFIDLKYRPIIGESNYFRFKHKIPQDLNLGETNCGMQRFDGIEGDNNA